MDHLDDCFTFTLCLDCSVSIIPSNLRNWETQFSCLFRTSQNRN